MCWSSLIKSGLPFDAGGVWMEASCMLCPVELCGALNERVTGTKGWQIRSQSWVLGSPWLRYTRRETDVVVCGCPLSFCTELQSRGAFPSNLQPEELQWRAEQRLQTSNRSHLRPATRWMKLCPLPRSVYVVALTSPVPVSCDKACCYCRGGLLPAE